MLCALSVVLFHYKQLFYVGVFTRTHSAIYDANRTNLPFYHALKLLYANGGLAVSIFWVISGFIFYWKYAESIHRRRTNFVSFFVLRFSRLYPLHFATLLLVAFLQMIYIRFHGVPFIYGDNNLYHFVLQLFFASNWWGADRTFNGPIWSVSAEILVYMAFFCLMFFAKPSIIPCLIAMAGANILFLLNHHGFVISCISFFFLGGLLQRIDHALEEKYRRTGFFVSALIAIGLVTLLKLHVLVFGQAVAIFLTASIVNAAVLIDEVFDVFTQISWVGNLTYSSYLIHFPVQLCMVMAADALHQSKAIFLSPVMLFVYLGMTFGLAAWIYYAFEVRMQDLIRARWFAILKRPVVAVVGSP